MVLHGTIAIGMMLAAVQIVCDAAGSAQNGTLEVHDHCSVALAGGKVECVVMLDGDGTEPKQHPGGKEWDFWFLASGKMRFLNPQNRTRFANAGTLGAGRAGCRAASYTRDRLRVDTLPNGTRVCVLTGKGRVAELTLKKTTGSPSEPLSFTYTLWE